MMVQTFVGMGIIGNATLKFNEAIAPIQLKMSFRSPIREAKRTSMSSQPSKINSPREIARVDPPAIDPGSLWEALSRTPGVGVSITDREGRLLFVNDTSMVLFSNKTNIFLEQLSARPLRRIDYRGKFIHDFHPKEYVRERLAMISRVIDEDKPLAIHHIYHGRNIHSTLWPIHDRQPPFNRVIVVTKLHGHESSLIDLTGTCETFSTQYIDLGELNILTPRELEVLVLLGNGMSVPKVAEYLHRSPKTVQRHKDSISKKLKVHSQAELVVIVTSIGLQLSDAKLKRLKISD